MICRSFYLESYSACSLLAFVSNMETLRHELHRFVPRLLVCLAYFKIVSLGKSNFGPSVVHHPLTTRSCQRSIFLESKTPAVKLLV